MFYRELRNPVCCKFPGEIKKKNKICWMYVSFVLYVSKLFLIQDGIMLLTLSFFSFKGLFHKAKYEYHTILIYYITGERRVNSSPILVKFKI